MSGLPADPHDGGPHEDVKDMSVYLRLDPQRDYRFMWVAQLAMSEPVPNQWKEMYDEQGYPYYVNQLNGKTSRRHPSDAFYNQLVKYEKIRELTEGPRQEVGAWMDFTDFDGSTYYYNFEINMSSSHRPNFGLQNKRLIDRLRLEATIELEHYIATKVQSMWRRHCVKKVIRERKKEVDAAIVIQRAFRRYINRDLDKRRRMAEIHSARRIQAHYRGKLARRRVKEMSRSRNQHLAATKIQARWRGRQARRKLVEPYVRRIQANWRGYQSRRLMLPLMQDRALFAAVVKVQAAWRARAAKTMAERRYRDQRQMWAAMKVQAHWRGFVTRLEYERMLEVEYEQNAVAAAERRRRQRKELEDRAARTIQNSWRSYKARQFLSVVKAVLAMQRSRKKKLEIQEARAEVGELRAKRDGKMAASSAKKQMQAAVHIQRIWRGYVGRRDIEEDGEQEEAAIKIQAVHRKKKSRLHFKEQQQASTVIANRIRIKQAKQRLGIMKATLKLQTRVRSFRAKRNFLRLKAAMMIERCCRGMLARSKTTIVRSIAKAVLIQRCSRGMLGRTKVMRVYAKVWAVVTMQRCGRGMMGRLAMQFKRLEIAASRIQAAWRGKKARREYLELLFRMQALEHEEREEASATYIQACWRARNDRRAFRGQLEAHRAEIAANRYQEVMAVVVQQVVRSHYCQIEFIKNRDFMRMNKAAIKIQTWWRRLLTGRVVQLARKAAQLAIKHDAATMIQKHYRCHAAIVAYRNTIEKRRASILYLQSAWRMKQARRERHRRLLFMTAVKLQARFRGKMARRRSDQVRCDRELEYRCALVIQQISRGYVAMQEYDWFRLQIGGALSIQARWRQFSMRRAYLIALAEHKACMASATVMQSICRTTFCVRSFVAAIDNRRAQRAAAVVQKYWRKYTTRQWFVRETEALKAAYRQRVVDRITRNYEHHIDVIEKAAVRIQKHMRGYIANKRVAKERRRQGAIRIQRVMRGWLGRKLIFARLTGRYDWMLVSSLMLPTAAERDDPTLVHLRSYGEQMLMPSPGSRLPRRFFWVWRTKVLCATLLQKVARGRSGRRVAVSRIRRKVDALTFGPELRFLRQSIFNATGLEEPRMRGSLPWSPSGGCLRRMEMIIIRRHDMEAAKFVQRCYRGRLGRRFMKVIRGHSNINKIRRVMMPIVLRTTAQENRSGALPDSDWLNKPAAPIADDWGKPPSTAPARASRASMGAVASEPFLNDAVRFHNGGGGFHTAVGDFGPGALPARPASVDIGALRRRQSDGVGGAGEGLMVRLGTPGIGVRPRRARRTRDVLVQPRSTYLSMNSMVNDSPYNQYANGNSAADGPMLPPVRVSSRPMSSGAGMSGTAMGTAPLGAGLLGGDYYLSSGSAGLQPRPGEIALMPGGKVRRARAASVEGRRPPTPVGVGGPMAPLLLPRPAQQQAWGGN